MTWSYNPGATATSKKDQVRFLIGDTLSIDQQLQDEEIAFALSQRASIYGAAADCCRALAAKFSRSVDTNAGGSKKSFGQLSKAYTLKASEYDQKATMDGAGVPYAGGISVADKLGQEQDDDRVPPQFNVGMDDNLLPVPPSGNETESQG